MPVKYHPLVRKTKIELDRLDKLKAITWEERRKFKSEYLPITFDPKLRKRALNFMDKLIKKLEENDFCIKFELQRCHIEMYGQLTEINLRHKYFRKRIKEENGYSRDTYEASNKLEFQVGSYARKGWLEKKTISIEDYLPAIYDHIEKDSNRWAELRKKQKIKEEQREALRKIEDEIARQKAIEDEKFQKLNINAENHDKANKIRAYLMAYELKKIDSNDINLEHREYLEWAHKKADEIDPLN